MKDMEYTKQRIAEVVAKVDTLRQRFGDSLDKIGMDIHGVTPEMWGFITDSDIEVLTWIIKTGVIDSEYLKPPKSRDTLGFVILFKQYSERALSEACAKQSEKLERLSCELWQRLIETHGIEGAKQRVKELWGDNFYMAQETRDTINNAYKKAKSKWELTTEK